MKKRLAPDIARKLGLDVKQPNGHGNPKYYLSKARQQKLKELQIEELSVKGKSTLRDSEGNKVLEWTKTDKKLEDRLNALREVVNTLKEDIEPCKPILKSRTLKNKNLCNQYTLTDYHLGMMSWHEETGDDWDLKIAESTLIKFFKVSCCSL